MINKWVRIFGFHWKNRRGGPNHKAPLRTFSMFLCTPRKTNMTGWNTNHFKTYLLLYMVIFHCHVFFLGGVPKLSELSNFIIYAWWTMQNDVKTLAPREDSYAWGDILIWRSHVMTMIFVKHWGSQVVVVLDGCNAFRFEVIRTACLWCWPRTLY